MVHVVVLPRIDDCKTTAVVCAGFRVGDQLRLIACERVIADDVLDAVVGEIRTAVATFDVMMHQYEGHDKVHFHVERDTSTFSQQLKEALETMDPSYAVHGVHGLGRMDMSDVLGVDVLPGYVDVSMMPFDQQTALRYLARVTGVLY